ncbi:MAG: ARMT1-like domain-containing protein [Clostridiales bacterium]|nr:ARMT1-like domain-containing protein [Clostridiales bacterium]
MNTLLRSECLECLTKKQLHALPADAAEDEKLIFLQKMFEILSKTPKETCAPVIVRDLNRLHQEMFGETVDYTEEKSHYNQLMLQKEQAIREKIHGAEDPLLKALRFSLVGNYIDFSAVENVEEAYLEKLLEEIESPEKNGIAKETFEKLKQDLSEKQQLLFLTDNAGEGVLDKLLLEVIREMYPQLNIRVLVRGKPVLNDVTMEDALEIGLQNVAEVYDNGNGIAGTWLPELSPQAKTIWEESDVIIAKGQANYETLRLCEKNIYFLFLCKCEMFCRNFQVPRFTGVLVHG